MTLLGLSLVYVGVAALERAAPGRPLPAVRGWAWLGLATVVSSALCTTGAGALLRWALPDPGVRSWPFAPSVVVGLLVGDLVYYWVHRALHEVPALWWWAHRLHHAAVRMDLAGLAIAHPLEVALTVVTTSAATTALGLSPEAADAAAVLSFANACLQHSNVATPAWIGWVAGRPEQHALHHARGVHRWNYAGFPVWDLVFGTLHNPRSGEFPAAYGFGDEPRWVDLLTGAGGPDPE
jgi:sterol desaturase/sphingolipid hydroxylase (fatty acid hydroxylase superfamily)